MIFTCSEYEIKIILQCLLKLYTNYFYYILTKCRNMNLLIYL